MARYESDRRPEIHASDLEEITALLSTFDTLTFNRHGEMVATLTAELPVIGPVVVSLYVREDHLSVYRPGDSPSLGSLYTGYLHELDHDREPHQAIDRDQLLAHVRRALRDKVAKEL